MGDALPVAVVRGIKNCGFNECWLQDQIWDNPSCLAASLRLQELVGVMKERPQPGGGRLDLLLKNPDDDTMYEVEVMLGETNPDHIIRTIDKRLVADSEMDPKAVQDLLNLHNITKIKVGGSDCALLVG